VKEGNKELRSERSEGKSNESCSCLAFGKERIGWLSLIHKELSVYYSCSGRY